MSYHENLKQDAIAKLMQLPTVNKATITNEYVNARTKITISCDCCECLITVLPTNLLKRGSISCSVCKKQKLAKANTKWVAPKWFQHRYHSIIQRTSSRESKHYSNYGGRGIKLRFTNVDSMWSYMSDLEGCSKELTIDRINNDGDYEKGNLRWVNYLIQNNNQRKTCNGVRQVNGSPRFQARITKHAKEVYLGTFPTYELAVEAVKAANEDKNNEYG